MVCCGVVWCDGEGYIQPRCDVIMTWYGRGCEKKAVRREMLNVGKISVDPVSGLEGLVVVDVRDTVDGP
jgi:hypothetical protein